MNLIMFFRPPPAFLFLFSLLIFSTSVTATEIERVAKVKTSSGSVQIVRGDEIVSAYPGVIIFEKDKLKTGENSGLGLIFEDGTMLTLGPDSEFHVTEYVFKPLEKDISFLSYVKKGTVSYVSGAIGRIDPDAVKIKTPSAYLGLRGTKVLIKVGS